MSVTTKLVGFLVALLAIFGAAAGIGQAIGPVGSTAAADHGEMGDEGGHDTADEAGDEMAGMDMGDSAAASFPKGLMVAQDGYTFRLERTTVSPGTDVSVSFTIEGPDGPVTEYDVEHEEDLHLIAVRRDFTGFQHVHP